VVRETSLEAFEYIRENGLLSKRRWQVYEYVFRHGPCTAAQVVFGLRQPQEQSGTYNTRLSELERMGLIKELGETVCQFTNRTVILWDVTKELPKKLCRTELDQQLWNLGFESLEQYYESEFWSRFKEGYFRRHERVCAVTGSVGNLHLHHLTYERLGAEKDDDVIPVCQDVHHLCHQLVDGHKVRLEESVNVIKAVYAWLVEIKPELEVAGARKGKVSRSKSSQSPCQPDLFGNF
jgi:hypothetical protein